MTLTQQVGSLRGSIVPLVTPFEQNAIDISALERLIDRQIEAGSHGISVGGTTGEPGTLSLTERKHVIDVAAARNAKRLPFVPGTGTLRLDETLELTHHARQVGADAALVITPYYIKPNQTGLYHFFGEVARATPDLPILLYNIPGRAGVEISIETVCRLRRNFPNIIGLKHSSKDVEYVSDLLRKVGRDFLVFCGLEALTYPMMAVGAVGTIAATANLLPKETAMLCQCALDGRHREALDMHYFLLEANDSIFWDTNPIPLKTVLSWMNLCQKEWREPLGPTTPEIEVRLRSMAQTYGLLERVSL
ncbi:MAG: 2,4-dihydroxyhept-2-ene-1,7-dioic acid aldolase [Deinococcaceae bacterium]